MQRRSLAVSAGAALLGIGLAQPAVAAGFAVQDYTSAAQLGAANAGAAAAAEDASAISVNPAGIARLTSPQVVGNATFASPYLPFTDQGSILPSGAPIGSGEDNGGAFVLLPSFFFASPLPYGFSAGVGLFPSFGLATEYGSNWIGRYNAQSSEVTSLDLAPTLAYRALPWLSFGISPVARYTKVKFTNAIDFGSIGAGLGIPGAVPGGSDGGAKVKVSAWSFAFNGGVLIEPTDRTRVGIAYFHNDAAKVTGSARFARSPIGDVIAAVSGAFTNTDASSLINLPDHANFGIVQSLTPDLDVRAGLTWTQWSSFKEERIVFANPNQPDSVMPENWRDTVTLSLGGNYRVSPALVVRAGFAYDETPIPDAAHRDARLPDSDRYTAAIGAGYTLTPSTTIDFAYQHVFGTSVALRPPSTVGDQLIGTTDLSADIVALQVTYRY